MTTPTYRPTIDEELKWFRGATDELPTVEEMVAPLERFLDRLADYGTLVEGYARLYEFGPADEVQPRIRALSELLTATTEQATYLAGAYACGDTLNQRFSLRSAMRLIVESHGRGPDLASGIVSSDACAEYLASAAAATAGEGVAL